VTNLYLVLAHYPVLNKHGQTIITSVTNLDIHDIARSAATYGVKCLYMVTPDSSQQGFVQEIISFWQGTEGTLYNANRNLALSLVNIGNSIEDCQTAITMQEGIPPLTITTTAHEMDMQISYETVRDLRLGNRPLLLIFGTGHGLANCVHANADYILQPISGVGDYNHLSVRSAVAVVLDRIYFRCI